MFGIYLSGLVFLLHITKMCNFHYKNSDPTKKYDFFGNVIMHLGTERLHHCNKDSSSI